jgi:hypothetical protein
VLEPCLAPPKQLPALILGIHLLFLHFKKNNEVLLVSVLRISTVILLAELTIGNVNTCCSTCGGRLSLLQHPKRVA